jgi:glycosidase
MHDLRNITEQKKSDFWLMGEVVHGDYSNWVNDQVLHSVTNYKLYKSLFSSHNENNLFELAYCLKTAVPDNGLPLNTFLDNHDQPRIASIVSNPTHLYTLYALLFTLPGIPSVYYGSEWGMKGVKENGSDQGIRPYIDIENSASYSTWLTGHISKLIALRKNEKTLKYGTYRQIYLEYKRPFVFERCYEGERMLIAVNIGNQNEYINLGSHCKNTLFDVLHENHIPNHCHILMEPFSAKILKEQ